MHRLSLKREPTALLCSRLMRLSREKDRCTIINHTTTRSKKAVIVVEMKRALDTLWLLAVIYTYTSSVSLVAAFAVPTRPRTIQSRSSHTLTPRLAHVDRYASSLWQRRTKLYSTGNEEEFDLTKEEEKHSETATVTNRLDTVMSQLTSAFPLWVVASAILGYTKPSSLTWVNQGNLISILLAAIMCGTGLTLQPADFLRVRQQWRFVPLGVMAQFSIMPLAAWAVGKYLLLHQADIGPSLFLGLVLVGCSPGGTASNLVSMIAGADVALSVVLTSCSTLLAVVATPALVKLLVGQTNIAVSGWTLCAATAKVVLGPVLLGMFLNQKTPRLARWLSRFTPLASVLLVSIICGGVVAQNAALTSSATIGPTIVMAVLLLHTLGFALGYALPRWGARANERTARTISIEVGMQNSALAVVLAKSMGAPLVAGLPGALSATAHSCLGSILAAVWRIRATSEDKSSI